MDFVNRISDHDLERHYLGMITHESESALLEEHSSPAQPASSPPNPRRITWIAFRAALVAIRED